MNSEAKVNPQQVSNTFLNKRLLYHTPLPIFIAFSLIALIAVYTDNLPSGLIGALFIMIVLGEILGKLGDHTPIIRSYLGGGAIVTIFVSSFLVYADLLPENTIAVVDTFMADGGFLNFYIAALITGSILGMNSKLLVQAGARYFVPIIGAVVAAGALAGIIGFFIGFGLVDAMTIIALPIMGGGLGAGAVPMAQVFSDFLGNDPSYYMSLLVPALALGNVMAIIAASLLNLLGKKRPSLTGNGQLMKDFNYEQPVPKNMT
ncbi:2-hydroxycarboxylate transporter family protein [Litoribacterium kuwaitense]|uniref:2-hydroxycarboxylate transporter family protein n=1 Tax=Litoribacterium kuwaitense TaxID=1398745 RepID=UPI0028AF3E2A|nr:2-hydroxycarboxylate transporter family protein [Litoribacterium kuwaitense]